MLVKISGIIRRGILMRKAVWRKREDFARKLHTTNETDYTGSGMDLNTASCAKSEHHSRATAGIVRRAADEIVTANCGDMVADGEECRKSKTDVSFDFLKLLVFVIRIACAENLGICIQNQFSTVPMSLPLRNQFVINTGLPKPTNQKLADVSLAEVG